MVLKGGRVGDNISSVSVLLPSLTTKYPGTAGIRLLAASRLLRRLHCLQSVGLYNAVYLLGVLYALRHMVV